MGFLNIGILDVLDVIIVALLMLQIYRMIRGTAALTIFFGIFTVYLVWVVVRVLNMELLSLILGQIIGVGALALLIVFQQEVRRYLLMVGNKYAKTNNKLVARFFGRKLGEKSLIVSDVSLVKELVDACMSMSDHKTGALIVIERKSSLEAYASTGDELDAILSSRLIENIFFKNSPLHDGAVIVRDSRIFAARCILPSSDNPYIPAHYGMRHRAAVGVSEHTDAVVVTVSEETGAISVIVGGVIKTVRRNDSLYQILMDI